MPRRHEHTVVADHPRQPRHGASRPLVGCRWPAPQPQLVAVVATHLVGRQPQQHDAGRHVASCHPAVELPAHPLDHRRSRQPGRPVPRSLGAFAVLGLGGHDEPGAHLPLGRQFGDELVGEVLADEHQRLDLHHRVVEALLDAALGRRIFRVGPAVVVGRGDAVGMAASRPEPGQDVTGRQRRQIAEAGQTHPGEQPDELRIGLTDVLEPRDREAVEEGGRAARVNDDRSPTTSGAARRHGRGEAPIGHADAHGDGTSVLAHGAHELLGEALVTTEVPRRPAGVEAQPSGLHHFQARCEATDGAHDGLERPGIAIGVVVEQHDVRTALLGATAALTLQHPLGSGGRRAGNDTIGVQDDGRHLGRHAGGHDGPVRAPDSDVTHVHQTRSSGRAQQRSYVDVISLLDGRYSPARARQPQLHLPGTRDPPAGGRHRDAAPAQAAPPLLNAFPHRGRGLQCEVERKRPAAGCAQARADGDQDRFASLHPCLHAPGDRRRQVAREAGHDDLEPVEHGADEIGPLGPRSVEARIDAHQAFERDAELDRRLDPQPGHVDHCHPRAGGRWLGGKGKCQRRGRHALARHRPPAHKCAIGEEGDQRVGDGKRALASEGRGSDGGSQVHRRQHTNECS